MKNRFITSLLCFVMIIVLVVVGVATFQGVFGNDALDCSGSGQISEQDKDLSAEEIVENYANDNGYTLDDYPQSLIELLDRNKETKEFVLNYPNYKDKHFKVNMKEYKNCDSVPLFMQWDIRWGYKMYGDDVAGLTACGPTCLSMVAVYLLQEIGRAHV